MRKLRIQRECEKIIFSRYVIDAVVIVLYFLDS